MSVMTRRPRTAYLLLTGATTLALSACSGGETDPRTQPPLVRVATAAPVTGGTREFTGIVSARVQSDLGFRSEEHTSELQSLMRISYAVFCLKKKKKKTCK